MAVAWRVVKLLLSALLLGVVAVLLLLAVHSRDYGIVGAAAVFFFLAALPWVKFDQPNRALSLAGVVLALALLFLAGNVLQGGELPRDCSSRRRLWCEVGNLLHAIGGDVLAAAPFALLGVLLLMFSARAALRQSR